jgi:ketosteroid isomerase-like protein
MATSEDVQERNVEFTRRSIGAWIAGDRSHVIEALADDIEVFVPSELANTGSYRGKDEFIRWIADWDEAWANLELDVRDLTPVGERHVIAVIRQRATGLGSGIPVEMEIAFLTDVRDAKIAALHLYATVEEAREVAERRESA